MPRDAYTIFFEKYVSKEELFDFGIKETITIPLKEAYQEWQALKEKIENNKLVYIRGFGRGGKETPMFKTFYKNLLNHENIVEDPTNNSEPSKTIRRLTRHSKTATKGYVHIQNYQISHVFSRTKNAYAFTAPWNIVYIPKILDPFTGHEAKGDAIAEFQKLFQTQIYKNFEPLIHDFNEIMEKSDLKERSKASLQIMLDSGMYDERKMQKLQKSIDYEFSSIMI